ncbi:uncharacterized protein LOC129773261 [Toxorhynchites rutilus septentrionalis]|uniref:uncharacterized protein LOC129773261 n=1 Tax=Toxorhynchites rutilus septentrionalis TaxID=329112 RepID=UPI00247A0C42|nr:uncharacterized protein LOC129773261 [Toxorhynchites rutilus septentrionalis]
MAERNSAKKKLAVATEEENSVNVISELEHTKDNIVDSLGLLEFYVQEFDKTEKIQGQVGAWAEKLEQFYDDYHRIVAKLESFSTEEEPVDLKGERIDFDTRYYALRAFYMSKLKKSSGSASVNPPPPVRPLNIRLPELILPKFSGKLEDWCVFCDSFESAVGSRDDISAVEKMHYLKGLVHGEAARILDPIKISEQGYKDAWRSLRLRFQNKRQLIKCHIKTLFDTPTMRKESAEELLTLVDRFEQQISVLKNLGEPADRWSSLLVYLLSVRLDPSTLREWENHCAKLDADNIAAVLGGTARDFDHINEESTAMPSYVSMVNYLQNYARVLQAVSPIVSQSAPRSMPPRPLPPPTKFVSFPAAAQSEPSSSAAASVIQSSKPCVKCGQAHYLYQCPEFRKMTVTQRSELVRRNRLCMNCMRSNSHYARTCSAQRCRVCSKKHHTLLHLDSTDSGVGSGSQSNTSCCVALQQQNSSAPQAHVASVSQTAKSATTVAVQQQSPSTSNNYNVNGSSGNPQYALVTHSAGTIPEAVFLPTAMVNIRDSRGRVCTVRCLLDCASQRSFVSKAACDRLQLPRIRLPNSITVSGIGNATTSVDYQSTVTIFSRVSPFTIKDTMLVLPSITVKLPQSTVDTRHWSIPRHLDLADPTFAVTGNIDIILGAAHFLRVLRYGRISLGDDLPLLQSTEFGWVVFGKCVLNNHDHSDSQRCQFSNPCTINELVNRFWQLEEIQNNKGWSPSERYCEEHFTANTVRNADGRYVVRLPKREELLGQLRDNRYNATKRFYGLERSFAANPMKKALYQEFNREYLNLGHMYEVKSAEEDLQPQYFLPHHAVMKPESTTTKMRVVFDASCRSKSGLSLNDVLLSGPTIQDTQMSQSFYASDSTTTSSQLTLRRCTVKSWSTSQTNLSSEFCGVTILFSRSRCFNFALSPTAPVVPQLRDTATLRDLNDDFSVTALGLRWEPETDNLLFKTPKWKEHATPTKRTVLSDISSLFDPLGLIGPTIARAKIKLQGLWKLQLDWDTPVPDQFAHDWTCFRQKLVALVHVRVRVTHAWRFMASAMLRRTPMAHAYIFAPFSLLERVPYVFSAQNPRLLTKVLDSVDVSATTYLWTDSTIVLNWILATPSTWKTFVANRVAEIQELTSHAVWHHVPSEDNPADLISRGKDLDELLDASLWWNGPTWLHSETSPWPETVPYSRATTEILETRKTVALPVADQQPPDIIDRYHSIRQVLRVAALLWRFCENCRRHAQNQPRVVGPLTPEDIDHALLMLIRRVQGQCFDIEIRHLTSSGQVDRKSKLRFLHPQIVDGIIRVGGRLHFARIPIDERHPIVLPANHRLTEMICRREHLKTLHAGPGLLLSSLRQRFWPLGGRNLVRKVVHRCVTCTRAKPQSLQQLMGNLPPVRVNQAYPFQNVGVDLAGPFYVRTALRNKRTPFFKAYIVVYVCMATKAAHLDLVTDLTTAAFIASLGRFVSRRGKPSHIFCDNATNFVGAQRELGELRKLFQSQHHQDAVARECTDDGIEFHFIPPRSPSFGGIWEACVKSAKMHLRRTLGNAHLTETELQTALCQVEAMLNSRPITPMPGAPTDELSLTPGHFLIGRPLNAMPDPDKTSISENRLSRWERVQQLSQHFWNRWHTEYLTTLQHRYRWIEALDNLAVGSIVVLKDEQLPPQKWALGRVLSVHPGTDGRVRVATVKTSSGIMQRAISKLCLLPVEIDPESVSPTPELAGPSSE